MDYWRRLLGHAWRTTKFFNPLRVVPPPLLASLYFALRRDLGTMNRWVETSMVLFGSYLVLWVVEFLYKLFVMAPSKLYSQVTEEVERLRGELKNYLEPKLKTLFGSGYPYDDEQVPGSYRLFRVGVRNVSTGTTVEDLKVVISDVDPRPKNLFPPLLLQAMHDRGDRKTTRLHPGETWYFDVVDQYADGAVHIVQTVEGAGGFIPSYKHTVTISASGSDVPGTSRRFVISVPTPRQGNQDLEFTPDDQCPASDGVR